MTSSPGLLDMPVPDIDTPLLLPTKYIKEKKITQTDNIRKKIVKIFDQFKRKPGR